MAKYTEWLYKNKKGEFALYPEKKALLIGWAQDGLSVLQIAKKIGISKDTLYDWVKKFPDFSDALRIGREPADYAVQNTLFKMATGYYVEEKTEEKSDLKGRTVKVTRRYIPPNVVAVKYWLDNRMGDKWRERQLDDGDVEDIDLSRAEVYGDEKP